MRNENIDISGEYIKLDSLLKFAGICGTGGEAKDRILSGGVLVNGKICLLRGKKIYDSDKVSINDVVLEVKTAIPGR